MPVKATAPQDPMIARLDAELWISERRRLRAIGWLLILTFVVSLALLAGAQVFTSFESPIPLILIPGMILVGALHAFVAQRTLPILEARSQHTSLFLFVSAAVEVSIPSLLLVVLMQYIPVIAVFSSPVILFYAVYIVFLSLRLDARIPIFAGFVAAIELGLLWYVAVPLGASDPSLPFSGHPLPNYGRCFALILIGLAAGFTAHQIRVRVIAMLSREQERDRVVGVFGRHVSPSVVDALLAQDSNHQSAMRYVCVMFLDIRSFTTLSEGRDPVEVVDLLNTTFGSMIELVNKHGGIINKFLGDGFMAVFGAPLSDGQDCSSAVECGLAILARLEEERRLGLLPKELRVGIGLHAGEAVTGNIGSERRKEYTVIGDVVNVAARIEGLNKQFESTLLVSEEVYSRVTGLGVEGERLGPISVKGRGEPVEIVRLM